MPGSGRAGPGAQDLLHDISDPKSELYGKFVDHATVNELIDGHHKEGVSTWLRAHGFDVREATVSLVHAVAPAAVVGASFNCTVRRNADISTGSLVRCGRPARGMGAGDAPLRPGDSRRRALRSASCRPAVHLPAELLDGVTGATFALAPRPVASGDAGLRARKAGDAIKRRATARALGLMPGAAPRLASAPRVSPLAAS